eukprot:CAMPEP_0202878714 /NCGR_PEP_ID=MMETSP1391-20130828/32608_1 /ASSEMBLY_ACC=CAM_ASM_000867 /TAXON_ID=1034604 /ORGANISM="Chlamydomonas leiostraca, Strain SAG 11-49" /LENGTH=125 /DNA_ID=CAMNT_0049560951 /DNA_START=26 /DNA_END=404 /DNA_ORIENTATION=-
MRVIAMVRDSGRGLAPGVCCMAASSACGGSVLSAPARPSACAAATGASDIERCSALPRTAAAAWSCVLLLALQDTALAAPPACAARLPGTRGLLGGAAQALPGAAAAAGCRPMQTAGPSLACRDD